jgi:DNA-binding response OmpR family regulator
MQTSNQTILLAEEDGALRRHLADNLTADSYRILEADDRAKAIALLSVNQPDLIILDVNGQTLAFIDAVRSGEGLAGRVDPDTPMIVLSAQTDRIHRIRVLERGGDDIIAKPFAYAELRARIAALLRRAGSRRNPRMLAVGALRIDLSAREVHVADRPVELSAKEYELLVTLAGDPRRVFTRAELLRAVWGYPSAARTRTLDSHAYRLRRKLSGEGAGSYVSNVWGIGYKLDPGTQR